MSKPHHIKLEIDELRAVAGYAAECAERVLPIFERDLPGDARARDATAAAHAFAQGGRRTIALRSLAMAAFRAARDAPTAAAAYLHPLASADQVKHILGAAAHAVRATELDAGDDSTVGAEAVAWSVANAPSTVATVLGRYPRAPSGGGRVGEILREIDAALRR